MNELAYAKVFAKTYATHLAKFGDHAKALMRAEEAVRRFHEAIRSIPTKEPAPPSNLDANPAAGTF